MKLLLDACVWGKAASELIAAGHDALWAGDWNEDPSDDDILSRAHSEARVVVTLDKDFGTLAVFHNVPHTGILRLVDVPARDQAKLCLTVIARHAAELAAGAIITAGRGRLRIRPPASPDESAPLHSPEADDGLRGGPMT